MSDTVPFFTQAAILDQYIQSANPASDPETLDVILEVLRTKPDLRKYFFSRGPHPSWATILFEHGFFATASQPEETSGGYRLPYWDVQEFLVSVATHAADVVAKHVTTIEAHPFYKARAVHAARFLPADMSESVLPVILRWLDDSQTASAIAEEAYELMMEFAKNGQGAAAFSLFRAVMKPQQPQNVSSLGEGRVFNAEATSILSGNLGSDDYREGQIRKGISLLQELDISQTAVALEEMLKSALKIQADAENSTSSDSSFWRNAIEDTGQDRHGRYKDFLLESLRDTLELWAQQSPEAVAPQVERYLQERYQILRRLGLHVLQRFPSTFKALASGELLNPKNLDDVGIHHEYFMLLKHGYPHLSPTEQTELLDRILAGPPAEHLERIVDDEPEGIKEDLGQRYSNWWIRDRLWMLQEHLPETAREILRTLVSGMGEPEHPEFTHWLGGVFSVSQVSPVAEEDLGKMLPDDLIRYLRDWIPQSNKQFGPERESHRALGRVASKIVWANLDNYKDRIVEIASIRPEYAINLLNRAGETEIDSDTLWQVRLMLCETLVSDQRIRTDMSRSGDSSWVEFRLYVANLLGDALKPGEVSIPKEYLPRARDILTILLDDPDPDQESDQPKEGWFGHKDPFTVAINHVRSQALINLIYYANQVAIEEEKTGVKPAGSNRMEPIVEAALTRKVDRLNDPSVALHSVFGREFARLHWLNRSWVTAHVDEIFPPGDDQESLLFYVAAWDAYVIANDVYSDILELLRDRYVRAIENLKRGYVTKTHLEPTRRLAEHILIEYLNSDYDIRSADGQRSLVVQFFTRSSPEARGQAVWSLWNMANHDRSRVAELWPRMRALWQWRLELASAANHSIDFNREMEWFSYILKLAPDSESLVTLWPLIEGLLPYIGRDEYRRLLWHALEEYLAKEVVRDPVRSIQFYHLMHDQLKDRIWYHGPEPRIIIETGASNIESRKETIQLIDKIARLGNHSFDDIHERYVK